MSADAQRAATVGSQAIRLTIPAKAEYITLVRLALSGLTRLRPLSEEVLGDLKLAVTEACTNSVRHGYSNGEGTVEIVYELQPDRLVVEVADDGPGFDADSEEPSEENLTWLRDVQGRLSALDGAEALIDGFGAPSGRPVRTF